MLQQTEMFPSFWYYLCEISPETNVIHQSGVIAKVSREMYGQVFNTVESGSSEMYHENSEGKL